MRQPLTTLGCLLTLLICPLTFANLNQEALEALAKREKRVAPPTNHSELATIIERSQQYRQDALSMNQYRDNALKDSPLSSVLSTPRPNPNANASGVMVFVSLTMPDTALKQLLVQSQQYQVPLVIRGPLPSGFMATASRITSLLQGPNDTTIESGFAISPNWFRQFNIQHVPAFVAIGEHCTPTHCDQTDYDIVHGNLSLPNALALLKHGEVGHIAKRVLDRQ